MAIRAAPQRRYGRGCRDRVFEKLLKAADAIRPLDYTKPPDDETLDELT
ncbi:MAG: hypothetical protein JWR89_3193 [Tardiphaga sp.]|nr:hypothetical protein [Tardiphaga sp.]